MRNYEMIFLPSEELSRNVKVYIHLPKNYYNTDESYPVLYTHDGNVLFNDFEENDPGFGMMDDYMKSEKKKNIIIIGVASGDTRNDELFPYVIERKDKEPIGGKTDDYLSMIIKEVKPLIDKKYRTLADKENTGMLGVSVGGTVTIYSMCKYQNYFTRFAFISSCHYPVHKHIMDEVAKSSFDDVLKVYSDVGTEESPNEKGKEMYLKTNKEVYGILQSKISEDKYKFNIVKDSKHEFTDWNLRFKDVIDFIFS